MNTNLVAKHNSSFQDYTSQLQGNGDLAILNFILVRHTSILNIVELGTFAGVTSLHLGVSMGLRERGRLYTFDVVDNRHPNVKKMFRKLTDSISFQVANFVDSQPKQVIDKVSIADLVLIDSSNEKRDGSKLALQYGKLMRVGSIVIISHFPGSKMKLNEWINAMVEIGFVYKYHDLVTSKHVLSTVGVFEKYGSKEEAKVKLCEAPYLNCKGESPQGGTAGPSGFTLRI